MINELRKRLFLSYSRTHLAYLDLDQQSKLAWFVRYSQRNYLPHLRTYDRNKARVLDVGCSSGYLLAALSAFGFADLTGLDLSPWDVRQAKLLVPSARVLCVDAFDHLSRMCSRYDIVVLKAVLEHTLKPQVLPLLDLVRGSLRAGGVAIVDVPNMDWLFSSHERYMDFTHEVGFTRESLRQVMSNVFQDVDVILIDAIDDSFRPQRYVRQLARSLIQSVLRCAAPEGAQTSLWARSMVGIGRS